MITGIQNSLGRHHRTLFGVLLAVIIGSFVFYGYGGSGSRSSGGGRLPLATADGMVNLADAHATRDARDLAALLSRAVHTDDFAQAASIAAARAAESAPAGDPSADRIHLYLARIVERLALANALGMPRPDEKTLAAFIRENRDFADAAGKFDPARFKAFTDAARDRLGLDDARLQNAFANAWRVSRVAAVASPDDAPAADTLAERLRDTIRTKWTVEYALFPRAGFSPEIPPDDKALAEYFEKNKENYRIPKRLKLRFAKVTGAASDAAKPSDADLLATAARRKDRFPLFGTVSSATFLLDNRAALETLWREEKAGETIAAKISETLLSAMPLGATRPDDAALDKMLKSAGLAASALPAYGADSVPANAGVPEALLTRALELSPVTWRTSAIPYGDSAYVFIYDGGIESRIPSLDEVRPRALADRKLAETDRLFSEAAKTKAASLAEAVKAGKSFAEAATAAGMTVTAVPVFERGSAPEAISPHLDRLDLLAVGGVSSALREGENRIVVHVVAREVPPAASGDKLADSYRRLLGVSAARSASESVPGATE